MTEQIARAIVDCATVKMEVRSDYSGRGMYGETTCAVEFGSHADLLLAVAEAAAAFARDRDEGSYTLLYQDLRRIQFDQMGRGYVVY